MTSDSPPIRVTRRFTANAERVFGAWLDPATACQFLYATPTGQMVQCDIDARVGGRYTIVDRREGENVAHVGEYLEIVRPHRLAFTLQVPRYSDIAARITLDLAPKSDGGCELTLTQDMTPEMEEFRAGTIQGWTGILEHLDTILER